MAERTDYDNTFKKVLSDFFWDALSLFLPSLCDAADKSEPPEELDGELRKVAFDMEGGAERVDMLRKIKLKNGEDEYVICHVEIQGAGGGDLPTRMMRYWSAIFLSRQKPPIGIAVMTAKRPEREAVSFQTESFGVKTEYHYKNYSLMDAPDEELLAEENRAGLVLYAAKCAGRAASGGDAEKYRYLREISALWAARKWEDKKSVLLAVNYLLNLTGEEYARQYVKDMENLEMSREDKNMYISVFERVYKAEGMEKGKRENTLEMAKNLLAEGVSPEIIAKASGLAISEIHSLMN